jgi:hypothetical protein
MLRKGIIRVKEKRANTALIKLDNIFLRADHLYGAIYLSSSWILFI